ncbi:Nucleoside-triphosphatase C1orf57 isoform 2 [Hibiscus syriacus]|uniref:Nucleoside-triphosphatase C1orf57 isoform 2 n=1 Tax=Hibiscus syriacus TaxID=106335 RepID=A0A6A2Z170_HIBSY|nr:Nucleoside-triphosphatase C1orf57 isoform 2 [Hibiscus syriacus]
MVRQTRTGPGNNANLIHGSVILLKNYVLLLLYILIAVEVSSAATAHSPVESGTMAGVGKCFLVTGPPGVGKTTLIMRVCEALKLSNPNTKLQGFYSQEIRQGGERVGFEVVTLDGRRGRLASSIISRKLRLKYAVCCQIREGTDLFIIDEVGKMELFSSYFFLAILNILQSGNPLLATVPIPKFGKDLPAVVRLKNHPGATIFTLDKSNRDATKEQIYSQLVGMLHKL